MLILFVEFQGVKTKILSSPHVQYIQFCCIVRVSFIFSWKN